MLGGDHVRIWRFDFCERKYGNGPGLQASTGNYSHVAIFLNGQIYHARVEGGVLSQSPEDFFELEKSMTFIAIRRLITKKSKSEQRALLGAPYNASFIQMEKVSIVPSSSLNYFLSLKPFP